MWMEVVVEVEGGLDSGFRVSGLMGIGEMGVLGKRYSSLFKNLASTGRCKPCLNVHTSDKKDLSIGSIFAFIL